MEKTGGSYQLAKAYLLNSGAADNDAVIAAKGLIIWLTADELVYCYLNLVTYWLLSAPLPTYHNRYCTEIC